MIYETIKDKINAVRDEIAFSLRYRAIGLPRTLERESRRRYNELRRLHKLEVEEFFLYRLWRSELTETQWSSFIGWKKHIEILCCLNSIPYRCLTQDKLIFSQYASSVGIPTPKVLALLDPDASKGFVVPILKDVQQLFAFLQTIQVNEIVLKPVNGTCGQCVQVLRLFDDNHFENMEGKIVTVSDLQNLCQYTYRNQTEKRFLIQERVLAHEVTANLSNNCPFSYRVITLVDQCGEPNIMFVYGKLPATGAVTDNLACGGLALPVDEKGFCLGGRSSAEFDKLIDYTAGGFKLVGWELPFYQDVCDLAIYAATQLPMVRCIAWDIAVTNKGLVVFEGNNPWNKNIQQVYERGLWQGIFAEQGERALRDGPRLQPWW